MKKLLKFYLSVFVLFSDFVVFAQPGTGGVGEEDDPVPAPINSKLILLGVVGIAFVLYTFRKKRKIV